MKSLANYGNILLEYYIENKNHLVGIFEVIHQLIGACFYALSLLHCVSMVKFITQCISMVHQ